MADPSFVDLVRAPLRALIRAQRALAAAVLQWLRRAFPADKEGVGQPRALTLPIHDPHGRFDGVSVPVAVLGPPPALALTEGTVEFDVELVHSRAAASGRRGIVLCARPCPPASRRRSRRQGGIHVQMTVRATRPGPLAELVGERLSEPTRWRRTPANRTSPPA